MTAKEQAINLLSKIPNGNARIFCSNQMKPNGHTNPYWERVIWYLDNIKN